VVEKAPDAFRTISEVAQDLDLPQHVLRFWETRFQQIKPLKRGGGRRYYRPDDIDLLRGIQHLLYGEGYTIRGAQRILKDHGVKFVQSVWKPGAAQPAGVREVVEREPEPAEPLPPARPASHGRRADADSAHRRLFGLLPSFLSTGIDEQRLAESRAVDTSEPQITPSPALAVTAPGMLAAGLAEDKMRKLQDTLRELQECRKLLDTAMASPAN
jgi:DNA-binding transcriptional MerR regulator